MDKKIRLIFLTLLVYGVPLFVLSTLPFFQNFLGKFHSFVFDLLFYQTLSFSALGMIFDSLVVYCVFLLLKDKNEISEKERVFLIASGIKKIFVFVFVDRLNKHFEITHEEKVSVLFYCVKVFFTPVMVNFAINNFSSLIYLIRSGNFSSFSPVNILNFYFHLIFTLILVADTLIFAFGYILESPKLNNVVRSVEPTALGWAVTLMCYPPFNKISGDFLGWYSSDFNDFGNINITIAVTALSLLFFGIYVWASFALGFKASNLTNRGIVDYGPYKYVRHPAYISKNLSWWLMGIPFIKIYGFLAIFSLSAWTFIYFLRAVTEERHLSKDQDYIDYIKKVKYMFIPGVF